MLRQRGVGDLAEAISLVCLDEEIFLRDIEKLIKRSIPSEVVRGYEPDPGERAEPIQVGRRTLNGGPRRGGSAPRRDHLRLRVRSRRLQGSDRLGRGRHAGSGSGQSL